MSESSSASGPESVQNARQSTSRRFGETVPAFDAVPSGGAAPGAGAAAAILGGAAERSPIIGALSAFAVHADCPTTAVALAVRADLDQVCAGTAYKPTFGQDPQAVRRGETFETRVEADGYTLLIELLRGEVGFPPTAVRIEDLRAVSAQPKRAQAASGGDTPAPGRNARGDEDAPPIIDRAVVAVQIGGRTAYFEADSVAAFDGGPAPNPHHRMHEHN